MLIGVISKFPPKGEKHTATGGVAGYTKNLVTNLSAKNKVIVYADKLEPSDIDYFEDGSLIFRIWNKGVLYPFKILAKISKHKPDIVHIQHEFFLYGGAASSVVFLLLLLVLKFLNIPSVTTIHGIVPLSSIDINFVKENKSNLPPFIAKLGFLILTKCINFLSSVIIVHEKKFIDLLQNEYNCRHSKCKVIHHGIEVKNDSIPKLDAKHELGLENKKVILFFGYITGYKGIELLIDAFEILAKTNDDYVLLLAGGEHPRFLNVPSHKEYVNNLKNRTNNISSQIIFTGFVPENKIPIYFSSADVVVFPYTVGMASSGSMSFAIAYNKPFLVSEAFGDIVGVKEAVFNKNPEDLADKMRTCLSSEAIQNKLISLSSKLKEERSWDKAGESTNNLYHEILSLQRQNI